jgi:GxxExxY protein
MERERPWVCLVLRTKTRQTTKWPQKQVGYKRCVESRALPPAALKRSRVLFSMENCIHRIAQDIWSSLGPGYSESVYHCAFEVALRAEEVPYETERIVPVFYKGQNVGHVRADLIIDRRIVIELKSVSRLNETYRIQTRNYLTLLGLSRGYLINFPDKLGPLEFERIEKDAYPPPEVEMF